MSDGTPMWSLENFTDHLDIWKNRESPSQDLVLHVTAWVLSRLEDPYQGVRRESGFPNLWYGPVPGSDDGNRTVVVCSYTIEESRRAVCCMGFATLSRPI